MILVDTSVLVDYFRGTDDEKVRVFDSVLAEGIPFGINDFTYQELLQGSRNEGEFRKLKEYLETIPFFHLLYGKESYEKAAYLSFRCRKAGVTIRSTIDALIAEIAIENDLYLLHNDKDFENMSRCITGLKIWKG